MRKTTLVLVLVLALALGTLIGFHLLPRAPVLVGVPVPVQVLVGVPCAVPVWDTDPADLHEWEDRVAARDLAMRECGKLIERLNQ